MRKVILGLVVVFLVMATNAAAQRLTGSLTGQVLDPQGNAVPNVKINVSSAEKGFKLELVSSDDGSFVAPDLVPGNYKVSIQKEGSKTYATTVTIRVGAATNIVPQLELGAVSSVVTVEATALTLDTAKSTVQGVVTGDRIDSLPLNGRNFLALATLEPGVQIVDGGSFDPTKNQFVGVSVGGRSGRVTRIQVDGVDITDETVGTTVMNLTNESIQEFGIAQSSLDVSTDLTSAGAINIITRSGGNDIHGSGFGFFRRSDFAADTRLFKGSPQTPKPPFARDNWGGRLGGPFLKDRWFWHAEYEDLNQAGQNITNVAQFPQFTGAFGVPVKEHTGGARTDINLTKTQSFFYRYNHNDNIGVTGFGGAGLAAFANKNSTNSHVAGWDYYAGRWVHSVRFSFLKFVNGIVDGNSLAGTPVTLDPGGKSVLVSVTGIGGFQVGPNATAPQATFQQNRQAKYDGSVVFGRHTLRFGGEYNRIDESGFASFFGLGPRVRASFSSGVSADPFNSNGAADPLNYKVRQVVLGNGLGFFSEKPVLGLPFGGFINNRMGIYMHDTWRWTTNFTVNAGVRYVRDDGLTNHDLPRSPLIGVFEPELGATPRNDNRRIGPQAGFAWNVLGNNKWVIRGGGGIYYETNIFNNILFDRAVNLPPGLGNATPDLTSGLPFIFDPTSPGTVLFDFSTQCTNAQPSKPLPTRNSCFGAAIGRVIPFAVQAETLLQQKSAQLAAKWPPPGIPPIFDTDRGTDLSGSDLIDPTYKSPYGAQINIGIQRQIKPGLVFSADYVMNRGVHFNMVRDRNRIGASDTLDPVAALAAMNATFNDFGCSTGTVSRNVDCVIARGGTISNFAGNGLGAGSALDGFAFSGKNKNFRSVSVIEPIGLSRYQAVQVRLTGRVGTWHWLKDVNTNITYSLGRFKSSAIDQDFLSGAAFNDLPTKFYGPANLDRTHQVGVAFEFELPYGFRFAASNTFKTGFPSSIFLPVISGGADEIFYTDLNGDGSTADPLLGTNRGSFSRDVQAGDLNALIAKFNSNVAGTLGPAAQALVQAGLFSTTQLTSLGAVLRGPNSNLTLSPAPAGQLNNPSFYTTDIRFSWRYKVLERLAIEPMVEVFNLFNHSNGAGLGGFGWDPTLSGSRGSVNGTNKLPARVGLGSGSFSSGIPRAFQFGIRVSY